MGGGNSVLNISKSINDNITELTQTSIETSSTSISQNQTLNVNCTEWNKMITDAKIKCASAVLNAITMGKMTEAEGADYCTKIYGGICGADHVSMKGVMQISTNTEMSNNIHTKISNGIKNSIDNAAKQSTGLLQFGDNTTTEIDSATKNITSILQTYVDSMSTNISSAQVINIKDGNASFITQDSFLTDFQVTVLKNKSYTDSVSTIANAIKNESDQENGVFGGGSTIMAIVVSIIVILIIIGIILWLLKKKRNKEKTGSD
jgi:hypothetical protein